MRSLSNADIHQLEFILDILKLLHIVRSFSSWFFTGFGCSA